MKSSRWLIILLIANLCSLGVIAWQAEQLRHVSQEAPLGPLPGKAPSVARVEIVEPEPSVSPDHPTAMVETVTEDGFSAPVKLAEVEDDYFDYMDQLRAIGLPEKLVRDIVAANLRESFGRDRRLLFQTYLGDEYWRAPDEEALAELALRQTELEEEMDRTFRSILGDEARHLNHHEEWRAAEVEHRLNFLADEKRIRASEILLSHTGMEAKFKELADGRSRDLDEATLYRILEDQERKNSRLWEILSPQEFEEVELRTSWTADNLNRAMIHFDPTEAEFREIFRAWRAHDEELALIYGTSQPDPGNQHVFEQIREVLGEERYREYRETWWKRNP